MDKRTNRKDELKIQMALAEYMQRRYPGIIFRSDLGGIRLTIGQAVQVKRLQGDWAFPDFQVCAARRGYYGLFIEIKVSASEVYRKDGTIRQNKHIREQLEVLQRLLDEGYLALFGCGLDHCMETIDEYLGG